MSEYSVKVTNNSGDSQNVAIYQQYPDLTDGLPLVWISKQINNGNDTTFTWEIDWALNWGTTPQKLTEGVQWTSGGPVQSMSPTTTGGANAMGITYKNKEFETSPLAYNNPDVSAGDMLVMTDTTFTVEDAELMSISVYMNSLPAFAVQGEPNGQFLFQTHPTYWLCVTSSKQGVAVSETYVSSPTQFTFNPGITSLEYTLNGGLQFIASS